MKRVINKRNRLNQIQWELHTKRNGNFYHQYVKPKVKEIKHIKRKNKHHHKRVFIYLKVYLPWTDETIAYQLPKDLQQGAASLIDWNRPHRKAKKLSEYFENAIVVVPTQPYPHPHLVLGMVTGVAWSHKSSLRRTRSQFLQWDNFNLKHIKFLLHDYDKRTKIRFLKQMFYFKNTYDFHENDNSKYSLSYCDWLGGKRKFWNK